MSLCISSKLVLYAEDLGQNKWSHVKNDGLHLVLVQDKDELNLTIKIKNTVLVSLSLNQIFNKSISFGVKPKIYSKATNVGFAYNITETKTTKFQIEFPSIIKVTGLTNILKGQYGTIINLVKLDNLEIKPTRQDFNNYEPIESSQTNFDFKNPFELAGYDQQIKRTGTHLPNPVHRQKLQRTRTQFPIMNNDFSQFNPVANNNFQHTDFSSFSQPMPTILNHSFQPQFQYSHEVMPLSFSQNDFSFSQNNNNYSQRNYKEELVSSSSTNNSNLIDELKKQKDEIEKLKDLIVNKKNEEDEVKEKTKEDPKPTVKEALKEKPNDNAELSSPSVTSQISEKTSFSIDELDTFAKIKGVLKKNKTPISTKNNSDDLQELLSIDDKTLKKAILKSLNDPMFKIFHERMKNLMSTQ